ncbi:14693_t:CDS:1, partial [Gigaspora rosea]
NYVFDIFNTCYICGPDKIIQNGLLVTKLKSIQFRSRQYHYMMEWVPYNVICDIEEIGK